MGDPAPYQEEVVGDALRKFSKVKSNKRSPHIAQTAAAGKRRFKSSNYIRCHPVIHQVDQIVFLHQQFLRGSCQQLSEILFDCSHPVQLIYSGVYSG